MIRALPLLLCASARRQNKRLSFALTCYGHFRLKCDFDMWSVLNRPLPACCFAILWKLIRNSVPSSPQLGSKRKNCWNRAPWAMGEGDVLVACGDGCSVSFCSDMVSNGKHL